MTTGAPLYLVSACDSAEEFVAAFRRYADRAGLFVPIASPLPQGRRGRIALTLKNGGVMVEGEAEIVQSSAKSPLHGRAGMVIKFVEPDELSKVVLEELDKARLAMKPAPPSVPPRPAEVPAEPRPVPPALGGRIDAANALAECVVIGDASALREIEGAGGLPKAGQKFIVPSIPAVGGRPKTPTASPEASKPEPKPTTLGMPALKPPSEAAPKADPTPPPAKRDPTPLPAKRDPTPLPAKRDPTPLPAAAAAPAEPAGGDSKKLTRIGFPAVKPPAEPAKPADPAAPKATTLGMTSLRVTETQPVGLVPQPGKPPLPAPTPTRPKSGTTPPRHPTPAAPLPVTRMPAKAAPVLDSEESTDLTEVPIDASTVESGKVEVKPEEPTKPAEQARPQRSGGMRASEILAAVQVDDWTMTPDAPEPTVLPAQPKLPADPKPLGRSEPEIPEPTPAPGGPPTGDWTMSLDPDAGWSKPEKIAGAPLPLADKPTKIEKRIPPAAQTPSTGNPVHAVASQRAIEAVQWEDKPTSVGEKIEIDPTLMEPLQPLPADEELSATNQVALGQSGGMTAYPPAGSAPGMPRAASASGAMAPLIPPPLAPNMPPPHVPSSTGSQAAFAPQEVPIGFAPTLLPGQLPAPSGPFGYPAPPPSYQTYQSESVAAVPMRSNKRLLVIAASAVAVVIVAIVLAFTMGGKHKTQAVAHGTGSAGSAALQVIAPPPPQLPIDAAVAAVVVPDASAPAEGSGSATHAVATGSDAAPPNPDTCNVEVTSNPPGAEVSLEDKTVLGTTPATFPLPCGAATKLYLRKSKYLTVLRSVTPAPAGSKVTATLGVAQFSVKVTSTPAGATITVGGKPKGVTPTTVALPAFTTQAITLVKDGYLTDSQKVVIKSNGLSHHVVLKKGVRHR